MRILLVMIEPPLPFGNAAGRWYYVLLRGLVQRGHRVTALASCTNPDDAVEAMGLFPSEQYDLRCYPTRSRSSLPEKLQSFLRPMSYLFSAGLRHDLEEKLAAGYDVLHLEQLFSAALAPRDTSRTLVNVHYLFDIDMRDQTPPSLKQRVLQQRICRTENALLRRMRNITSFTPRLTHRIREINPLANTFTVPLGIDASLYAFEPMPQHQRPTLGLIGSFNWGPSFRAAQRLLRDLWPAIKRRVPEARLLIVGRHAKQMHGAEPGADVIIHENVPDPLPYFRQLDVMLYAPPVGSGMKVKILEAMAIGTPIVTNDEGVEGLPAVDGVHAGIANDDAGIVERALALLSDPSRREQHRVAARKLVETHCSPQATLDQIERVYERMGALTGAAAK